MNEKFKHFTKIKGDEIRAKATKKDLRSIILERRQQIDQLFEKMRPDDLELKDFNTSSKILLTIEALLLLFNQKDIEHKKLSKSTSKLDQELKGLEF